MKSGVCNYLYGRDVKGTGKFCAGGTVNACQVGKAGGANRGNRGGIGGIGAEEKEGGNY